jgi:hypothetical protein
MAKWTREGIIRHILDRESAGLPLNLGDQGVESTLYQAASRIFGTWRNAVMAAGIDPERAQVQERWSPSKILTAIRALSRRRRPLRPTELKKQHGTLMRAARRIFGSWSKAVAAAGVDPLKLRRFPPWTRQRIIEAILTRALKNEPLGSRSVSPRSLADAGTRVFGSWGLAVTAAGLDPRCFGYRGPSGDNAATHQKMASPDEHNLCAEECGAMSGIKDATPASVRIPGLRWTGENVLQAILARLREHQRMNATAVYKDENGLYRAALRRFGTWRNALLAAGLNPDEICGAGRSAMVSSVSRSQPFETEGRSASTMG